MRIQHDIFQTPNHVTPTIEPQPTPDVYQKVIASKTMPMWRVQTEGYTEGNDQLIGLVSRDAGFLDSPDTEWISSGVNSKNPEAVAIGRHGNFFLWGFAASPTFLTEEAKLVFVNAVHYIKRFDHQAPIARKRQGTSLRSSVMFAIDSISDEGYGRRLQAHNRFVAADSKRNDKVRARIAAGEKVSKFERQMLDRAAPKPPGRFQYVRRYFTDEQWQKVADDRDAIRADLLAKLPFLRPQGWYEMVVDEDLVKLGVGNNDIAMLDKAIKTWAAGDNEQVMRELLMRYTDQSFATVGEWRNWLASNRARLFYTEAGGFKWLVNTLGDATAATGDRHTAKRPAIGAAVEKLAGPSQLAAVAPMAVPTAQNPVAARLRIEAQADGSHAVVVDVTIFAGWHAYDALPAGSPYTAMVPTLVLPKGMQRVGEWARPSGDAYHADPNVTVYEGKLSFRCTVRGGTAKDLQKVVCELGYQVCDESMCQAPTTIELTPVPEKLKSTFSISR